MTDAPQPSPAPVSMNSRLIGLAVLALIALVALGLWRRTERKPDAARVDAARAAARPHFAAFERCLLGGPLAHGEKPGQRLRNVILANETQTPDPDWPHRCTPHVRDALGALSAVRSEDMRVDRVVSALYSARIPLSQGRPPAGVDALWDAAVHLAITGGTAPAGVVAARAPLHPLTGEAAAAAAIGPRHQRVLQVEAGRLLVAGPMVRVCRVQGARVTCSDGPTTSPSVGYALVPSAPATASARPADVVLEQVSGAPARLLDAASWTEIAAREHAYAAFSQRGAALLVREGVRVPGTPPSSVVLESFPEAAADGAEVRFRFSLVLPPRVVAGFAYYGYADMRVPRANAPDAGRREVGIGVIWLPDEAGAGRPSPEQVSLPSLPVQVLACALDSGRVLVFTSEVPTSGAEPAPRAVEVRFYDAAGASTAVVRGELGGTAAVMDCVGDGVSLIGRKQVVVAERRALRFTGLRCSPTGCQGSAATLAPMDDVPDVLTLSDGRALVVYRTAATGGLRARIATLEQLATAREYVLADEAVYGGLESSHRWLVRDGAGAMLVLETRAGIIALHVAGDGTAAFLRP